MRRRFMTLDVFTRTRFAGNPLAIVLDAQGLDTEAMQTVAREFSHPETVFVLPSRNVAHRVAMRIFTPASELPFAGHPTVGTAVALARAAGGGEQQFVLEQTIGPVSCRTQPSDAGSNSDPDLGFAEFALPKLPARVGDLPDAAALAAALGLEATDIDAAAYPPSRWSAGVAFSMVPVRSLQAAAKASPDMALFERTFGLDGPAMVYVICNETVDASHDVHVRMFAPARGILEDPATGSALAAFAGLYVAHRKPADGVHRLMIEQGFEMGRPSLLTLTLILRGGALTEAKIGGDAVVVTEGTIEA